MEHIWDCIVVGGGPAGLSAALNLRRRGRTVLVLSGGAPLLEKAELVENYLGMPGVTGQEMMARFRAHALAQGAEIRPQRVGNVMPMGETFLVGAGSEMYTARTVILACGVSKAAQVPGEAEFLGRGVSYCATCDGMLYRGKTVVVVGGGNSAAEDALFLSRVCKKVYLVHRGAVLTASKSYWTALQKAENVEFIWNSRVVELLYGSVVTGIVLEGVESGNRSELACDGVFIAVGRIPNTGLFHGVLEMDAAGYLIADETTRTALPGVFAVGDVRTKPLRQIITAAADGAVASKYAEAYLAEQEG